MLKKILLFMFFSAFSFCALAESSRGVFRKVDKTDLDEIWINPGLYSYHFNTEKQFNNNNIGFGVEYRYSTVSAVAAGRYINSMRENSSYAAIYWQPVAINRLRIGAALGVLNGYPDTRDGNWFLFAIPLASYEYKNVGINFTLIPPIADIVYSSFTIQLKVKLK